MNCPYCGIEMEYLGYNEVVNDDIWCCTDCGIMDQAEGFSLVSAMSDDDENYDPDWEVTDN